MKFFALNTSLIKEYLLRDRDGGDQVPDSLLPARGLDGGITAPFRQVAIRDARTPHSGASNLVTFTCTAHGRCRKRWRYRGLWGFLP